MEIIRTPFFWFFGAFCWVMWAFGSAVLEDVKRIDEEILELQRKRDAREGRNSEDRESEGG